MQVNGLSGAGSKTAGIKMAQKMDSFSINIKNEIARKQKEQQEISSNKSLSAEEKMKKRQEIQRQINDLYNQLRQHQIEQRRENSRQRCLQETIVQLQMKINKRLDYHRLVWSL